MPDDALRTGIFADFPGNFMQRISRNVLLVVISAFGRVFSCPSAHQGCDLRPFLSRCRRRQKLILFHIDHNGTRLSQRLSGSSRRNSLWQWRQAGKSWIKVIGLLVRHYIIIVETPNTRLRALGCTLVAKGLDPKPLFIAIAERALFAREKDFVTHLALE